MLDHDIRIADWWSHIGVGRVVGYGAFEEFLHQRRHGANVSADYGAMMYGDVPRAPVIGNDICGRLPYS